METIVDWRAAQSGTGLDGYFDLGVFQLRRRFRRYEIKFIPYPQFEQVMEHPDDQAERQSYLDAPWGSESEAKCVAKGIALGLLDRIRPGHTDDPIVSHIVRVLQETNRKLSKAELLSLTGLSDSQWAHFLAKRPPGVELESHGRGARYWFAAPKGASAQDADVHRTPAPPAPPTSPTPVADSSSEPVTLGDYIGQPALRQRMDRYISAAQKSGKPLDHVLLSGPPGVGKSMLADIIAAALSRDLHKFWASSMVDVDEALSAIPDGDVVFIDEIHGLSNGAQEQLFKHMRRPITIIGATNYPAKLLAPLRERFPISEDLELYNPEEIAEIIKRASASESIPESVALEIGRRSRGTPRTALALVRRLRDLDGLSEATIRQAFEQLEIDEIGLTKRDRAYLAALAQAGKPVGLDTLATIIKETAESVELLIEPYLLQQGLIERGRLGRTITEKGQTHLQPPSKSQGKRPGKRSGPKQEDLKL